MEIGDIVSIDEECFSELKTLHEWINSDLNSYKDAASNQKIENKFIFIGKSTDTDQILITFQNRDVDQDFYSAVESSKIRDLTKIPCRYFHCGKEVSVNDLPDFNFDFSKFTKLNVFLINISNIVQEKQIINKSIIYHKCMICGEYNPWMESNSFCYVCKTDPRNQFKIEDILMKLS